MRRFGVTALSSEIVMAEKPNVMTPQPGVMTRSRVAMTLLGFADTDRYSCYRDKMHFVSETAEELPLKLQ